MKTINRITIEELQKIARIGGATEVDRIMELLDMKNAPILCRMADSALGLVEELEGRLRIRHYLFEGTQIQRNHAALYFKRRGRIELLEEAVARGCIDKVQAFSH